MLKVCPKMSLKPDIFVPPLRTVSKFDFPSGTLLALTTHDGFVMEGTVSKNPMETDSPSILNLINVKHKNINDEDNDGWMGFQRFLPDDIKLLKVLMHPEKTQRKRKPERIYKTHEVSTMESLHLLEDLLLKGHIDKVGLNMHGVFVGRSGDVGWITLFLDRTIVCIDVIKIVGKNAAISAEFWAILKKCLFSNDNILKVIYNSRPIADYLYHTQCISLCNVFDIQVAEIYLWAQHKPSEITEPCKGKIKYKLLSEILMYFLQNKVLPEEFELLKDFEKQDFLKKNPLMNRPVTDKQLCKCVAVDIKYLLDLHQEMTRLMMIRFTNAVSAQMESLVIANNASMEMDLSHPTCIPSKVFHKITAPEGQLLDLATSKTKD